MFLFHGIWREKICSEFLIYCEYIPKYCYVSFIFPTCSLSPSLMMKQDFNPSLVKTAGIFKVGNLDNASLLLLWQDTPQFHHITTQFLVCVAPSLVSGYRKLILIWMMKVKRLQSKNSCIIQARLFHRLELETLFIAWTHIMKVITTRSEQMELTENIYLLQISCK